MTCSGCTYVGDVFVKYSMTRGNVTHVCTLQGCNYPNTHASNGEWHVACITHACRQKHTRLIYIYSRVLLLYCAQYLGFTSRSFLRTQFYVYSLSLLIIPDKVSAYLFIVVIKLHNTTYTD